MFSSDIELSKAAILAEKKLFQLRDELIETDPCVITGRYFEKSPTIKASRLYEALLAMPKPIVHHLHLTAACDIKFLIDLTYNDYVYYSERKNFFKVSKKPETIEDCFQKVVDLRKHWENSVEFDEMLTAKVLLGQQQICSKETHQIWENFQPKFMLTLGNHILYINLL